MGPNRMGPKRAVVAAGSVRVIGASAAAADDAVVEMVVLMSNDGSTPHATYLPEGMGQDDARAWIAGRGELAWAVVCDDSPVGWIEFKSVDAPLGVRIPARVLEREVWLVPIARGRRVVQAAMGLVRDAVQQAADGVVGIAWASNTAAVRGMQNAGFEKLGEGWWGLEPRREDERGEGLDRSRLELERSGEGGMCEVWVLWLNPA